MKWLLCLITLALCASEDILIHLSTESKLYPLYFEGIQNDGSFSSDYAEKLKKVLVFDFNYNGYTRVVSEPAKERLKASIAHKELTVVVRGKQAGPVALSGTLA